MTNSPDNSTPNDTAEASGFSAFWSGASTGMKALVIIAAVAIAAAIVAIIIVLAGLFSGNGGNTPDGGVTPTVLPSPAPGVASLTASTSTSIYAGPGLQYHIIGILEAGLSAEVAGVSADGQWWAIKYPPSPNGLGWVANSAVQTHNTDNVPVIVAPPVPTPTTAPPIAITDWLGEYFSNPNLQGEPVVVQNDPSVDFNWGTNPPAPGMPNENWSARWTIEREVPGGTYNFSVWVDDGVRIWVDDTLIIDGWVDGGARNYVADVNLANGSHRVRVEYFQATGGAMINLAIGYVDPTPAPGQPTAVINAPSQAQVGQAVQFSGDGSIAAPGTQIVTYEWDFGDGAGSSDVNPTHVYNAEGVYRVQLTVVDNNGQSNASAFDITISAAPVNPPTAVINYSPSQAAIGQTISFDGSESRGASSLVSYAWDFGDGSTANAVSVTHAYQNAGNFNVTLTVTDSENLSGSATVVVQISAGVTPTLPPNNPPTAVIEGPASAEVGIPVAFNGSASYGDNPITDYDWNFGDGGTAKGSFWNYTYNTVGNYSVILVVTDNTGLSGNTMSQISVSGGVEPTAVPTVAPPPLEGVIWNYDDALPATQVTAFFQSGTLSGTGGCNDYSTGYTVNGSSMTINPIIIGGVACGDPIDQQESSYFAALGDITSYQIQGNKLTLSGPTHTLIYTAGPQPR